MSTPWLKIEKSTVSKPEILQLSSILGIHPLHAFGLCVKFWAWCDDHMSTGNARGVTKATLETLFGNDGFVTALEKVGWIEFRDDGLVVPNFDRHLSQSSKQRALTAERQYRFKRKSNAESVTKVTPEPLLDKIREENIRHTHTPAREAPRKPVQVYPSEEEAWTYANGHMLPITREGLAIWHAKMEARGWTIDRASGPQPIADWKAHLRGSTAWIREEIAKTAAAEGRVKAQGMTANGRPAGDPGRVIPKVLNAPQIA